ncbi:MBL fold metallo-hydrolase [Roseomonas sp. CAU 1739]|uniref:MBL fold metallo-hydrolase n=1 Tax=Roseomonas sp. CAU 1739 TaxID=3140364 RepID=UPI00325AF34E
MPTPLNRRGFLRASALAAPAFACTRMVRDAHGAETPRISAPIVDSLSIQVVVDNTHDIFISGAQVPGVRVERNRGFRGARQARALQSQHGLSLHLTSRKGTETKHFMLDFAYTPDVLNNNIELLGLDIAAIDALILSHGHLDHFGGLEGFLARHRGAMRDDLTLYLGGEDAFCYRHSPTANGAFETYGNLDRRMLEAARLRLVLSESPMVIGGHAFTTGAVPRVSQERVLPNSFVEFGQRDGAGCSTTNYASQHFTPAEMAGQPAPDQHLHEHGTCFHVKGRGLVVITSCGHDGILNTVRRAREVTGVEKVHALFGGFHLAAAQADYLDRIVDELKTMDIDHVFPMHCSGTNFLDVAKRDMPQALVLCTTGSRFSLEA